MRRGLEQEMTTERGSRLIFRWSRVSFLTSVDWDDFLLDLIM